MTRDEVFLLTQKLWGRHSSVFDRKEDSKGSSSLAVFHKRYWVGATHIQDSHRNHLYGNGNTWDEAFNVANEKLKNCVYVNKLTSTQVESYVIYEQVKSVETIEEPKMKRY